MEFAQIFAPLANLGSMGILVAYLIWSQSRTDRIHERHRERELELEGKKAEADRATAVALALLTEAIKGTR